MKSDHLSQDIGRFGQEHASPQQSEISIWLDSFNDIFSDFDPRPFKARAVSDDFIFQLRKVASGRTDSAFKVKLLLPRVRRHPADESSVIKRLHEHFTSTATKLRHERRKTIRRGLVMTVSGVVLMIMASYISFIQPEKFYIHQLLILFEPAGWFLLWTGLDHFVYQSKKTSKDYDIFRKMSDASIEFDDY